MAKTRSQAILQIIKKIQVPLSGSRFRLDSRLPSGLGVKICVGSRHLSHACAVKNTKSWPCTFATLDGDGKVLAHLLLVCTYVENLLMIVDACTSKT
jgi:hypothetical protein